MGGRGFLANPGHLEATGWYVTTQRVLIRRKKIGENFLINRPNRGFNST